MANKNNNNSKLISISSYFLIGIIWYFVDVKEKNKTTNFHVKQALNLILISFGVSIILSVLSGILIVITFGLFGIIAVAIHIILNLIFLVLAIIGIVNIVNDKEQELPVIGKFAKRYLTFK
jgi:uncharacterized membrane protein